MGILKRTLPIILTVLYVTFATSTEAGSQDLGFRDEFTGTSLHPEWSVKAEESERWALIEDDYLMIITNVPSKESGLSNVFVYNKDLPENYEIRTKMTTTLNYSDIQNFNRIFLGVQWDRENQVLLQVGGDGTVVFDKFLKGDRSRLESEIGEISGDIFLSVRKKGVAFEGAYSLDGSTWQTIGEQFFIGLNGKPVLGGYNTAEDIADTGVRVDYFELIPG